MISLLSTLNLMYDIYQLPLGQRFERYISTLQGGIKGELIIPISAYNPMAKVECIEKLKKLIEIKAEEIVENEISDISIDASIKPFTISINLADDTAGGWTNAYTTHYDYTFKPSAFLSRNMAIILLFSSKYYSLNDITILARKTVYRYIFQSKNGLPGTLSEHIAQEYFVQKSTGSLTILSKTNFQESELQKEDYSFIFNALYGDAVSLGLNFKSFGNQNGLINPF